MAQLRLVNLEKSYGDAAAVRGIDVTIADGELVALLGPSGCGKTTTLQMLAGFLKPDVGEIWADDRLISSPRGVVPPERRNMGMVFQGYALWPHMTVTQNVAFGLEMRRLPKPEVERAIKWVLDVVNLNGFEQRYPHELSGGQQQRVALARSLVVRPGTLLLDEPLSNLDASLREQMRFEIRRVHQETGITMVYVTHDQSEAMVIADRIAVMNAGRVEQIGSPRDIYEQPRSRFVAAFIGQANCLPVQRVAPGRVRLAGCDFEIAPARDAGGTDGVSLAIRPSAVRVVRDQTGVPSSNVIRARLVSQVYLGDQRDVRFELADGTIIRTIAPATESFDSPSDTDTLLNLPVEDCQLVSDFTHEPASAPLQPDGGEGLDPHRDSRGQNVGHAGSGVETA
jgi:iron(III) transport system ATP-binding protein